MTVDVFIGELRRGAVVEHDHVGGIAVLEFAELYGESPLRDLRVVPEEHRRQLAPAGVGMPGGVFAEGVAHLIGLQHVADVAVGAQPQRYSAGHELRYLRRADGVAHVRFGVMRDGGAGLFEQGALPVVDMDAVDEDGTRPRESEIIKPLHDAFAVFGGAVGLVRRSLCDMDVEAVPPSVHRLAALFKCLVG
ncbi:hypothetical protein SDC9_159236 [bioreactor metagenome]|uniref:Uncharacterized protein n=1 Tax=bioreactor metagenome TaxID=1076179 RepID=A0A645FCC3_9ZZZZ